MRTHYINITKLYITEKPIKNSLHDGVKSPLPVKKKTWRIETRFVIVRRSTEIHFPRSLVS